MKDQMKESAKHEGYKQSSSLTKPTQPKQKGQKEAVQ